ncbi:hypothetical protein WN944_015557 [Citrus x changshan-huyou]|uniref:Uncharacterized protein n=2 Tax=Citrus TaxID=2706 RepID=A0AAP0QMS6_9ROSI
MEAWAQNFPQAPTLAMHVPEPEVGSSPVTQSNILLSIYGNKESVDETLVDNIREPANDDGALDAFVSIARGSPGPNPVQLMPSIYIPVLVLWGNEDPFTPLDGPVGEYFSSPPS